MGNRQSKAGSRSEGVFFWQRALEAYAVSGLTVKRFCENEGLVARRFYYWRKKLRGSVKSSSVVGQATSTNQTSVKPEARFKQIAEISPSPASLRIEFPDGVLLHVPGHHHDPALLQRVIDLLRERSC